MANQQQISSASELIASLVDKARTEMVIDLYNLGIEVDDIGKFAEALLGLDVQGTLKLKLQKATSVYANAHRQVLESTIGFAQIEGSTLSTFASLNEQLFDSSVIRTISEHIKNQVVKGVQAGMSAAQIVEGVINSSISNAQMQTLVNTTLNTYSRQVTNQMMKVAPKDTKYIYIGPVDDRTRDECLEYASSEPITEAQIEANGWGASLVDGGGFNCRHKWEIVSEESESFFEGDKTNA